MAIAQRFVITNASRDKKESDWAIDKKTQSTPSRHLIENMLNKAENNDH